MDEFYLQDSRSYVGNDVLWWRKGGKGYTSDLREAEIYTREEAQRQHDARPSDIPWPKAYIDGKTRPAVDMQYIKRAEAIPGSGIVLQPPPKRRKERDVLKCGGCGRFMSVNDYYGGECQCGTDNRP